MMPSWVRPHGRGAAVPGPFHGRPRRKAMAWTRLALAVFCSLATAAAAAGQAAAPQPTAAPATPPAAPPPKTGLPPAAPAGTTRPTTGPTGSPFDAYDPEIRA